MEDELTYPGSFVHTQDNREYYIAKVHPKDAYYKYNLVGCRIRLHSCCNYGTMTSVYDDTKVFPFYYMVKGEMQDGPFAGEEISFYKVMLSRDFPFFTAMKEAIKDVP